MPRGRHSSLIVPLTPEDRTTLQRWQRSTTISSAQASRGRAILLLADGHTQVEAARRVGMSRQKLRKWAQRYIEKGIEGLVPQPRWDKRKDVA